MRCKGEFDSYYTCAFSERWSSMYILQSKKTTKICSWLNNVGTLDSNGTICFAAQFGGHCINWYIGNSLLFCIYSYI